MRQSLLPDGGGFAVEPEESRSARSGQTSGSV
jgi:hypothetical protein